MKSMAEITIMGRTAEEWAALQDVRPGVCSACQTERDYISPAGLCDECMEKKARRARIVDVIARLPLALRSARLEDLRHNYPDGRPAPKITEVKRRIQEGWAQRESLYIHGPSGGGKSTMMAAAFIQLARAGQDVWWISDRSFFDSLKAGWKQGGQDAEVIDSLVWYARSGALFIDDLGTKDPGRWALEVLDALVSSLYESRPVCLWVSSNYNYPALARRLLVIPSGATKAEVEEANTAVERVVSRIFEMMTPLEVPTGGNWRMGGV